MEKEEGIRQISVFKYTLIVIFFVVTFSAVVFGITYSWFSSTLVGSGFTSTLTAGVLDVDYADTALIEVTVGAPIQDSTRATMAYKNTFTLSHGEAATVPACYTISLNITKLVSKFASEYLKWELYNVTTGTSVDGNFSGKSVNLYTLLENGNLPLSTTATYQLRIWLSYDAEVNQTDLLQNNSGTALEANISVTSSSGNCSSD